MTEIRCRIELRAASDSPGRIVGTIIETGRIAADRPEVFAPGSISWPAGGMRLLAEHEGREVMRFEPLIDGARVRIDAPLPDTAIGREAAAEIRSGRKADLSVEFHALQDARVSGVREIRAALVPSAALVASGAYDQAQVEVRKRARGRRLWL